MHLSDLEALVCLAEEGSFSRAAKKLNRSQSSVTKALQRLEAAFQVQLLDRTSRRAVLTSAGASLVGTAGRMLTLWGGAVKSISTRSLGGGDVLRLAANRLLCDYLIPALVEAFRQNHPRAKIEVVQCPASDLPTALLDQDLDFGFLSFLPRHLDLGGQMLFRDDLALLVAPSHSLAAASLVTCPQLAGETFLAHSARTPSRQRLEYQFSQEGVQFKVAMELPSLEAIKHFVACGAGVTILPRICAEKELLEGSLISPPMKVQPIDRDIRVAFRRSRKPSILGAAFLTMLLGRFATRMDKQGVCQGSHPPTSE